VLALPEPRGPVTDALIAALRRPVGDLGALPPAAPADALADEDLNLALYLCYELHYRGLPGVDDAWEWEPALLAARRELEALFLDALHDAVSHRPEPAENIDLALRVVAEDDGGRSLSKHVERAASLDEVREFLVHRSAYQLKEADPHSFAVPRLSGAPKAALVEVQTDEYGGGRADRMHSALFGRAMDALGLDSRYGAYVELIPGITLATVNLMSLFGLHRRWRGAIVGHLALFEMTSSIPNARYARGLRRLGQSEEATEFFDEHVEADAVHEQVAAVDLAGGLARQEPALAGDILWGARTLAMLEDRWAEHLLDAWEAGRSSLRAPLGAAGGAEADELVAAVAERTDA
jgi:hypothetical protein